MDEAGDVCSADLEAEAEIEAEYTQRSLHPVQYRLPPSVVHANQEAHFYTFDYTPEANFCFTQGANEADGAGPASSDEEETGPTTPNPFTDSTGTGFTRPSSPKRTVTETRAEIPGVGTAVLYMPN